MGHFLWLSDLHLDPFYGTEYAFHKIDDDDSKCIQKETLLQYPYGRIGCDSPISLLDSSLQSVKNDNNTTGTKIDFILITGDLVRHGTDRLFSSSFTMSSKFLQNDTNINSTYSTQEEGEIDNDFDINDIISASIRSIRKIFPTVPIIPVLGNNDVTPDYYLDVNNDNDNYDDDYTIRTGVNNSDENTLLAMARNGLSDCFLSEEESQTFSHGGYFSRIVQTTSSSSILILSLNTVIYSMKHQPAYSVVGDDPFGQFAWIESQLQAAMIGDKNSRSTTKINAVYIVGHIPFTIGSYRHSQFWHERFVDHYMTILRNHQRHQMRSTTNNFPIIQGHLFGHMHSEEFRLLSYNGDGDSDSDDGDQNLNSSLVVPLFIASSLTPIYSANPSFRIMDYDNESGMLLDYTTHYLNLSNISNNEGRVDDVNNDKNWVWNKLPSFTESYNVSDLSSNSLESVITLFEKEKEEHDDLNGNSSRSNNDYDNININSTGNTNTSRVISSLWETFMKRQYVYSSYEDDESGDDGDDGENTFITEEWICTLRAISKDAYIQCIEDRRSSLLSPSHTKSRGGIILYLTASTVVIIIGVFVVFVSLMEKKKKKKKYNIKRRHYRRPISSLDGVELDVINNNNDQDDDSNLSSNSTDSGIAMTTIKVIAHATAGEFI